MREQLKQVVVDEMPAMQLEALGKVVKDLWVREDEEGA